MKKITLILLTLISTAALAAPQKLTVMLNSAVSPDHAPLVIANEQGYFKEVGLDVQLLTPTTAADVSNHIAQDQADLGITYEPQLIEEKIRRAHL